MQLTDLIRKTKFVNGLKARANSPRLGGAVRWAARQLRNVDSLASRANAANRAHDKAQEALLDSYKRH